MPKDCYFETHWETLLDNTPEAEADFHKFVRKLGGVVSRNTRKAFRDGKLVMSATLRNYTGHREMFESDCRGFEHAFQKKYPILDQITEFSIFDSAISQDADWVRRN